MQNFSEYFLLLERVGWRLTDFDFDAIDLHNVTDIDRRKARDTAITESAVPHYVAAWAAVRDIDREWELRQFVAQWAGEEHRHSEALGLVCDRLGVDITAAVEAVSRHAFVDAASAACPSGCFNTVSGLLTYTMMQELVTHKFYANWAKATSSVFLRDVLGKLAADEMRHHQWFANALERYWPRAEDPQAYRRAVVDAIRAFNMPHAVMPVDFPYLDDPDTPYFTDDDFANMRKKLFKILRRARRSTHA